MNFIGRVPKRYSRASLVCDSRIRRTLFVPLPWWYTQHSGQALALASLQLDRETATGSCGTVRFQ